MDERLQLTSKQLELVQKFNELCREMTESGIGFINQSGDVLVINKNHVEDWVWPEEMLEDTECKYDDELVDFDDMTLSQMQFFYIAGCLDDNMGIRFKK